MAAGRTEHIYITKVQWEMTLANLRMMRWYAERISEALRANNIHMPPPPPLHEIVPQPSWRPAPPSQTVSEINTTDGNETDSGFSFASASSPEPEMPMPTLQVDGCINFLEDHTPTPMTPPRRQRNSSPPGAPPRPPLGTAFNLQSPQRPTRPIVGDGTPSQPERKNKKVANKKIYRVWGHVCMSYGDKLLGVCVCCPLVLIFFVVPKKGYLARTAFRMKTIVAKLADFLEDCSCAQRELWG